MYFTYLTKYPGTILRCKFSETYSGKIKSYQNIFSKIDGWTTQVVLTWKNTFCVLLKKRFYTKNIVLLLVVDIKCVSDQQFTAATSWWQLTIKRVKLMRNNEFQYVFTGAKKLHFCLITQYTHECTLTLLPHCPIHTWMYINTAA